MERIKSGTIELMKSPPNERTVMEHGQNVPRESECVVNQAGLHCSSRGWRLEERWWGVAVQTEQLCQPHRFKEGLEEGRVEGEGGLDRTFL